MTVRKPDLPERCRGKILQWFLSMAVDVVTKEVFAFKLCVHNVARNVLCLIRATLGNVAIQQRTKCMANRK